MKKIVNFFKEDKKRLIGLAIIVVFLAVIIAGYRGYEGSEDSGYLGDGGESQGNQDAIKSSDESVDSAGVWNSELLARQDSLKLRFGEYPGEGFLWDTDGTLLSLGDPEASAEDVVGYYINGIRTLDFITAQRYSRNSNVVSRFEGFHDSGNTSSSSYLNSFYADMYRLALESIQYKGITGTAPFADGKTVFFVDIEILDLSSKDFWRSQKDYLYNELYIYSKDESDQTKAEQFVYQYVIDFYKSGDAPMRNVSLSLTVEKFPDVGTGWLVSRDKDIDDYCYYTDGNVVAKDILDSFRSEGREYVRELREKDLFYDEETGLWYDSMGHVVTNDEGTENTVEGSAEDAGKDSGEGTIEGSEG